MFYPFVCNFVLFILSFYAFPVLILVLQLKMILFAKVIFKKKIVVCF